MENAWRLKRQLKLFHSHAVPKTRNEKFGFSIFEKKPPFISIPYISGYPPFPPPLPVTMWYFIDTLFRTSGYMCASTPLQNLYLTSKDRSIASGPLHILSDDCYNGGCTRYVCGLLKPYASSELYDSARIPLPDVHLRRITAHMHAHRRAKSKSWRIHPEKVSA